VAKLAFHAGAVLSENPARR